MVVVTDRIMFFSDRHMDVENIGIWIRGDLFILLLDLLWTLCAEGPDPVLYCSMFLVSSF